MEVAVDTESHDSFAMEVAIDTESHDSFAMEVAVDIESHDSFATELAIDTESHDSFVMEVAVDTESHDSFAMEVAIDTESYNLHLDQLLNKILNVQVSDTRGDAMKYKSWSTKNPSTMYKNKNRKHNASCFFLCA